MVYKLLDIHTEHKMEWHDHTRYTDACKQGCVTLEIYKKPQGPLGITAYICNFWIKENWRGRSYGSTMLERVENIARKEGQKSVFLCWDRRDSGEWVLEWYKRCGYDDVAFDGNGDKVYLEKKL